MEKANPNKKYKQSSVKAKRKYYDKNISLIKEKDKKRHKEAKEQCKDYYIKRLLKEDGFPRELITPELIENKTGIIKTKRIIKQLNHYGIKKMF